MDERDYLVTINSLATGEALKRDGEISKQLELV